jgi:hypothetical protein
VLALLAGLLSRRQEKSLADTIDRNTISIRQLAAQLRGLTAQN